MCSEIELQTDGVDIIYFPKGSWGMEGRASVSRLPWSGGGGLFVTFLLQKFLILHFIKILGSLLNYHHFPFLQ